LPDPVPAVAFAGAFAYSVIELHNNSCTGPAEKHRPC
jgi:hypothetical protein